MTNRFYALIHIPQSFVHLRELGIQRTYFLVNVAAFGFYVKEQQHVKRNGGQQQHHCDYGENQNSPASLSPPAVTRNGRSRHRRRGFPHWPYGLPHCPHGFRVCVISSGRIGQNIPESISAATGFLSLTAVGTHPVFRGYFLSAEIAKHSIYLISELAGRRRSILCFSDC